MAELGNSIRTAISGESAATPSPTPSATSVASGPAVAVGVPATATTSPTPQAPSPTAVVAAPDAGQAAAPAVSQPRVIVEALRSMGYQADMPSDEAFLQQVMEVFEENQRLRRSGVSAQSTGGYSPEVQAAIAAGGAPPQAAPAVAQPQSSAPELDDDVRPLKLSDTSLMLARTPGLLAKDEATGMYRVANPADAPNFAAYVKEINDYQLAMRNRISLLQEDPQGWAKKVVAPLVSNEMKALQEKVEALQKQIQEREAVSVTARIQQEIEQNFNKFYEHTPDGRVVQDLNGKGVLTPFGKAYAFVENQLREVYARLNQPVDEGEVHLKAMQAAQNLVPQTPPAQPAVVPQVAAPAPAPQAAPVASPQSSFLQRVAQGAVPPAQGAPPQEFSSYQVSPGNRRFSDVVRTALRNGVAG